MNDDLAHETDDWLSLQEASEQLGVATSTLRRWGDAGKVSMKRTLGGHRRFSREAIERIAGQPRDVVALVSNRGTTPGMWGVDEREMARQEWHARLATQPGADRMRGLGQRLLGLLIQFINRRQEDQRFLAEAHSVGANYGREAYEAKISLHDMVEAFLFFRRTFSQLAMPLPGISQPTDLHEAAALAQRIDRFMDSTLLGTIAGYEEAGNRTEG